MGRGTLHLNRMLRLFGEKMSGVVAFGYPLATWLNTNALQSFDCKAFVVLGAGLEPAQPQWPKDFKSFVSTIPPSELLFSCRALLVKKRGKVNDSIRHVQILTCKFLLLQEIRLCIGGLLKIKVKCCSYEIFSLGKFV